VWFAFPSSPASSGRPRGLDGAIAQPGASSSRSRRSTSTTSWPTRYAPKLRPLQPPPPAPRPALPWRPPRRPSRRRSRPVAPGAAPDPGRGAGCRPGHGQAGPRFVDRAGPPPRRQPLRRPRCPSAPNPGSAPPWRADTATTRDEALPAARAGRGAAAYHLRPPLHRFLRRATAPPPPVTRPVAPPSPAPRPVPHRPRSSGHRAVLRPLTPARRDGQGAEREARPQVKDVIQAPARSRRDGDHQPDLGAGAWPATSCRDFASRHIASFEEVEASAEVEAELVADRVTRRRW